MSISLSCRHVRIRRGTSDGSRSFRRLLLTQNQSFDVLVIGSGASGGWACKRLAEAGLKVALLEAGRPQSFKNFTEHQPPFELKYRNLVPEVVRKTRPIQSEFDICTEYNYEWFCNDLEESYSTQADKPFHWLGRLRMTGGRTNVWGRVSLRFSDFDLKSADFDGYGENGPLSYKDIEPYYDLVENYVGICGLAEGLAELPDGKFQPPMPLTCQEVLLRHRAKEKLGWTVTPTRSANLTRSLKGRSACHYCGPCERGCQSRSYFNSAFTTVADALKSGNCTLISNAMVHQVLMDTGSNRARGVSYVDRNTRETREVFGRVVILCAQAQESVRILLNSVSRQHPAGLANSRGLLGQLRGDRQGRGRSLWNSSAQNSHVQRRERRGHDQRYGRKCRAVTGGCRREKYSHLRESVRAPVGCPRSRDCTYGRGPQEVGLESIPTDPRRQEPVCNGCRWLHFQPLPESDADHHGSVRPLLRSTDGHHETR